MLFPYEGWSGWERLRPGVKGKTGEEGESAGGIDNTLDRGVEVQITRVLHASCDLQMRRD